MNYNSKYSRYSRYSRYSIFIILCLLSIWIDFSTKNTNKCVKNDKKLAFIIILHHIFSTFLHFGWIIPNKMILKLYIIIAIFAIINWAIFKNCQITEYANNRCNGDNKDNKEDENVYFQDLVWVFGLKKYDIWNNYLHYIYIILCIFVAYREIIN